MNAPTTPNADATAVFQQVIERVLHEPDLPGGRGEVRAVRERNKVCGVLLLGGLLERLLVSPVDGRDVEDFVCLWRCVVVLVGRSVGDVQGRRGRRKGCRSSGSNCSSGGNSRSINHVAAAGILVLRLLLRVLWRGNEEEEGCGSQSRCSMCASKCARRKSRSTLLWRALTPRADDDVAARARSATAVSAAFIQSVTCALTSRGGMYLLLWLLVLSGDVFFCFPLEIKIIPFEFDKAFASALLVNEYYERRFIIM